METNALPHGIADGQIDEGVPAKSVPVGVN